MINISQSFLYIMLGVHILKSCNCPMSLREIQAEFNEFPVELDRSTSFEKNFSTLVNYIADPVGEDETVDELSVEDAQKIQMLRISVLNAFGGIVVRDEENRYSFCPILSAGDIMLLQGAFSNVTQFTEELLQRKFLALSQDTRIVEEKKIHQDRKSMIWDEAFETRETALTNCLNKVYEELFPVMQETLCRGKILTGGQSLAFGKTHGTKPKQKFSKSTDQLNNLLELLDRAIRNRCRIRITYAGARYPFGYENKEKAVAHFSADDVKSLDLNPCRILWDHGYCYLIATDHTDKKTGKSIRHFRVDWITEAEVRGINTVDIIPEKFKQEYIFRKKRTWYFQDRKYRNEHPLMADYDELKLRPCWFRTRTPSLFLDYFGENVTFQKIEDPVTEGCGESEPVYVAKIEKVQIESIRLFALRFHDEATLTFPQELRDEVRAILLRSAEQMGEQDL